MTQIGIFTRGPESFTGRVHTLGLEAYFTVVAAIPSDSDNAPDYRLLLGAEGNGPEVGAGWNRNSEKAGDYISLQIDSPVFAHPMRANLFQSNDDPDVFTLHWSRQPKRSEKD